MTLTYRLKTLGIANWFGLVCFRFKASFQQFFSYIQAGSLPNHRSWAETSTRHQPPSETTNCRTKKNTVVAGLEPVTSLSVKDQWFTSQRYNCAKLFQKASMHKEVMLGTSLF